MSTAHDLVPIDPRQRRRDAKRARILDEAWALARRDGVAALSLRDLAARVGLRQPSLYVYFGSKMDLYDAMYAQANQELLDTLGELPPVDAAADPHGALTQLVTALVQFSSDYPARHSLLFQRAVPGFEPSAESYALAEEFYAIAEARLHAAGLTEPDDIEIFSALVNGLAHRQVANEPGGERWVRLAGRVVDLLLADVARRPPRRSPPASRTSRVRRTTAGRRAAHAKERAG